MIYTQFGLPIRIVHAKWCAKAPRVPGWLLTCEHTATDTGAAKQILRFPFELKADNGYQEIEEAALAVVDQFRTFPQEAAR